jgi:hypothetical protein
MAGDPGGEMFETVYCVGTGDSFNIGEGLSTDIRDRVYQITKIQSARDEDVNAHSMVATLCFVNIAQTDLCAKV